MTRFEQHVNGEGANYTKRYPPQEIVYFEKYFGVDEAFKREKQIQNWSQAKKKALIEGRLDDLQLLAECQNWSHCENIDKRKLIEEDEDMVDGEE
jgi:putative endonuclease